MTNEELKHIQTICRDWLLQAGISGDNCLTILPGGPLIHTVEIELRSLMTPDNVIITSAVDMITGAVYASLLKQPGNAAVFIETP